MTNTLYTRACEAAESITAQCGDRVPSETLGALRAYLVKGREPSGFLLAVLENDLMGAATKADTGNLKGLAYLAQAIAVHAPLRSVGRPDVVDAWLEVASAHYEGR